MGDADIYFTDPAVAARHDAIQMQEGDYDLPKSARESTVPVAAPNVQRSPREATVRVAEANTRRKVKCCDTKTTVIVTGIICLILGCGAVGAFLYFFNNSRTGQPVNRK